MEQKIQLFARNFPESFSESDASELLLQFGLRDTKCLKRRGKVSVIISVGSEAVAKSALQRLHQLKIHDKRLSVEYYARSGASDAETVDCSDGNGQSTTPNESALALSNYVKSLHAVHPVDFGQPPPPYLKYRYPKPTRDIIDSICVTLESVPKFYTQVLHLMNRMNLPPPFSPKDLQPKPEVRRKDASQQTDLTMIEESLLAEGESELESDEDTAPKALSKHKLGLAKNRFKPYVPPQPTNNPNPKSKLEPTELFEQPKLKHASTIKLNLPDQLTLPQRSKTPPEPTPQPPSEPPPSSFITEQTLLANRIPADQLAELHVFKNYAPGAPSNKLYVKNLAKTVTEDDLRAIFQLFDKGIGGGAEIAVKLMQSGRMKGQAFVTFHYRYEEDLEGLEERPIERARRLTNGYILKDKPMVVMYGKQQKDDGEGEKTAA